MSARKLLLGLLVGSLFVVGCATKVDVAQTDPVLRSQLALRQPMALTGVTVHRALDGRLAPADADEADQALYRAFLQARPDLPVIPVPAVDGRLSPGLLDSLRQEAAGRGQARPVTVRTAGEELLDSSLMVSVQLVSDNTRTVLPSEREVQQPEEDAGADIQTAGPVDWSKSVLTERQIGVVMYLHDLRTGEMVWEARATTRDRQRYEYDDAMGDDTAVYVRDRLQQADQPETITRGGAALKVPDLIDLLEAALTELVARLPRDV